MDPRAHASLALHGCPAAIAGWQVISPVAPLLQYASAVQCPPAPQALPRGMGVSGAPQVPSQHVSTGSHFPLSQLAEAHSTFQEQVAPSASAPWKMCKQVSEALGASVLRAQSCAVNMSRQAAAAASS
jgi:hypothetical protein